MTAASPADHILLQAFGGVLLQNSTRPGPASYDAEGQRYVFVPPAPEQAVDFAIDVELKSTTAPAPLKEHLQTQDTALILRYWTTLETIAKLTDTPVLALLKSLGVSAVPQLSETCGTIVRGEETVRFERHDTNGLWIVVARRLR